MAENKTKPTEWSVAAFLAALPDARKRADAQAIVEMMQQATGEEPKMWGSSIIGFGSRHYQRIWPVCAAWTSPFTKYVRI